MNYIIFKKKRSNLIYNLNIVILDFNKEKGKVLCKKIIM